MNVVKYDFLTKFKKSWVKISGSSWKYKQNNVGYCDLSEAQLTGDTRQWISSL